MDEVDEGAVSDDADSNDDYEREQLEIALYSQIHFDQNTACMPQENNNKDVDDNADGTVDNEFVICVQGNEKKGFVATETNADIILNQDIENKYRNLSNSKGCAGKKKDSLHVKTRKDKEKSKFTKVRATTTLVEKHRKPLEDTASARKEIQKSTEIHAILRNTSGRQQNKITAEKLILAIDSQSEFDNEKDECVIDVEDDSEVEVMFCSESDGIVITDSEADSLDIVLGDSGDEKGDIQMNVHSNARYTYKKMSHEECLNEEQEEDVHSDDEGHWVINREDSYRDLMSATSRKPRYYKPIRCHNCDKEGHLSKNCPEPKKVVVCIMCAEPGHISRNCPRAMCFNCEEPGHDSKHCTAPRRSFNYTCYRCNMQGHDQNQCPDNWRQYHVTVTPGRVQQLPKQTKRKRPSCFNCGDEGHFGHECDEERMNKFTRISSPFICRYQTVKEINNTMKRFDEVEERPIKRSRSEGWIGNIDNSAKTFKDSYKKITFDRNFDEKKPYKTHVKFDSDDFVRGKDKKKPSPFAHIAKSHSDINIKTGRNNFDKMQFKILNKKKEDEILNKNINGSLQKSEKKKSKKKKKNKEKEKNYSPIFFDEEKGKGTQEMEAESKRSHEIHKGKKNLNENFDKRNRDKGYKISGQEFYEGRNSDERKVTVDSSSNNLTILAKRDYSEVFNPGKNTKVKDTSENVNIKTGSKEKGQKTTIFSNNAKTVNRGKEQKRTVKPTKKNSSSCSSLGADMIDFTVNREITIGTKKVNKSDRIQEKFSNLRNDNLRADDLFSLEKIKKLKSGGQFDVPMEEEDMEHQVHNNEWWQNPSKSKKRRIRRKKKTNHIFFN